MSQEEVKAQSVPSGPQYMDGAARSFKMMDPTALKELLKKGLGPKIQSVILFCNIEGSIVAKAGLNDNLHSQAAVLANICHEYIEFGHEAFHNNDLKALFIQHDDALYVAQPVHSLVLCFICARDANLGMVRSKVMMMSNALQQSLSGISEHMFQSKTVQAAE